MVGALADAILEAKGVTQTEDVAETTE
jgi:hypothetical protein